MLSEQLCEFVHLINDLSLAVSGFWLYSKIIYSNCEFGFHFNSVATIPFNSSMPFKSHDTRVKLTIRCFFLTLLLQAEGFWFFFKWKSKTNAVKFIEWHIRLTSFSRANCKICCWFCFRKTELEQWALSNESGRDSKWNSVRGTQTNFNDLSVFFRN